MTPPGAALLFGDTVKFNHPVFGVLTGSIWEGYATGDTFRYRVKCLDPARNTSGGYPMAIYPVYENELTRVE